MAKIAGNKLYVKSSNTNFQYNVWDALKQKRIQIEETLRKLKILPKTNTGNNCLSKQEIVDPTGTEVFAYKPKIA